MEYLRRRANYIIKPLIFTAALVLPMETPSGQEYLKDRVSEYLRQRQAQAQAYKQQRAPAPRYIINPRHDGVVVIDRSGGRSTATYHQFGRKTPSHVFFRDKYDPATSYGIHQSPRDGAEARRYNPGEQVDIWLRKLKSWRQRHR